MNQSLITSLIVYGQQLKECIIPDFEDYSDEIQIAFEILYKRGITMHVCDLCSRQGTANVIFNRNDYKYE